LEDIKIYTEDSYGVSFFKIIVTELKNDGDLNKSKRCEIKRIPGKCSSKFTRIMKLEVIEYEKIIINVDADGDIKKTYEEEKKHIPKNFGCKVIYILNENEIEEWILYAKNIDYEGKPSENMSKVIGRKYEKNMLPKIIENVLKTHNEKNRLKTYKKFEELLDALSS